MGNYTDLWTGDMLKFQLFQLGFFGVCILFIFIPWYDTFMVLGLYGIGFQYYQLYQSDAKKTKHQAERHIDSHTLREKDYKEDKIYSFLHYDELELRNPEIKIEDTYEYEEAKVFILTKKQKKDADLKHQMGETPEEDTPKKKKKDVAKIEQKGEENHEVDAKK
jgi:predicted transport protein